MRKIYQYSVRWIVLLLPLCISMSCVTQHQIVVDLFQPPEIQLPDSLNTITLLYRVSAEDREYLERKQNTSGSFSSNQEEGIRVVAGERALFGFFDHMAYTDDVYQLSGNIEWLDTLFLQVKPFPPPLSWDVVKRLCQEQHSDILISLESLAYNRDLQFSTFLRRTRETKNKVWSRTLLYNLEDQTYMKADYVFGITADWRIYDPSTNQILLEKSTRDSISYEVNGKTRDIVEKKLPSNLSAAEKAGILTGEQFARSILPTYKTVLRYYYGGGNKALRQATTFVRFRNWDEASEIWEAQLENANLSVKAKIWYNLALLSEMEGRPDEAISYLKKANQFHRDNATEKYQNTIIQEWNLNTGRL